MNERFEKKFKGKRFFKRLPAGYRKYQKRTKQNNFYSNYPVFQNVKNVLRARGFSRDSLLDTENTRREQNKITFILTIQFSKMLKMF